MGLAVGDAVRSLPAALPAVVGVEGENSEKFFRHETTVSPAGGHGERAASEPSRGERRKSFAINKIIKICNNFPPHSAAHYRERTQEPELEGGCFLMTLARLAWR